ncbi:MAG: PA14 domain-containing protein, partial [Phycisphaerae bacterium]|nr:PA14 domain-containing protein [Phycisphaerae bacterium]
MKSLNGSIGRRRSTASIGVGVALVALVACSFACGDDSIGSLKPFFKQYCYGCHGPEKQKGEIRLDTLGSDLQQHKTLEIWQNVLDQLNLGEMPPKKKPQPTTAEVRPVIDTLTTSLAHAYATARSTGGQTVLRRLNRHELRNTFRDLLYLSGADYRPDAAGSRLVDNNGNGSVQRTGNDPLRFFPEDEEEDGFFNLGDKLVMSDFLLKLTLAAAEEVLHQATHLQEKPKVEARRLTGHLVKGNSGHLIEVASREINPGYEMMVTGYERFGRLSPTDLRGGVGVSARYRVTVEVSAHNREHPWSELVKLREKDPFQLCLNIADTKNGGIAGVTSTPLGMWVVPDDGRKHRFSQEVWMDKTWTPWIGWENGPMDRGFRAEKVVETFLPQVFTKRPDKKEDKKAHDRWPVEMAKLLFKDGYPGPHLRIHSLAVEPLIDTWPPRSHVALYGSGSGEESEIRQLMSTFAERAFRRPVTQEEVEPYVRLVLKQQVEPVVILPGGIDDLIYRVYEGQWSKLPRFDQLEAVSKGELPKGFIDLAVSGRKEKFGVVYEGTVAAPKAGKFVFEIASDDGARILVDGKKVVEHDGLHGPQLKKGAIDLKAGNHPIRVEYFAYGQPNSFRAGWGGPG